MVLKYSLFTLFLFAGQYFNLTEGPLLTNYKSKIHKQVKALVEDKKGKTTLSNLNLDFNNLEGYSISVQGSNLKGFVFIKEVKACSLNGCTAKSIKTDNVGSEYYDISVVTDKHKVIQSIKVLDYFSDYGYQITSKKYLRKFEGKQLCDFSTDQDLVDGISGATISYSALITSLEEFCGLVE